MNRTESRTSKLIENGNRVRHIHTSSSIKLS